MLLCDLSPLSVPIWMPCKCRTRADSSSLAYLRLVRDLSSTEHAISKCSKFVIICAACDRPVVVVSCFAMFELIFWTSSRSSDYKGISASKSRVERIVHCPIIRQCFCDVAILHPWIDRTSARNLGSARYDCLSSKYTLCLKSCAYVLTTREERLRKWHI